MGISQRAIHHFWLVWGCAHTGWGSLEVCSDSTGLERKITEINMGSRASQASKPHDGRHPITAEMADEDPSVVLNETFVRTIRKSWL